MKKIGIFYGTHDGMTKETAEKIQRTFGEDLAECRNIEDTTPQELGRYENLIFGTPTMEQGDLPEDWRDNFNKLHYADLQGKPVAVFGLGDQEKYPDHFADAVGLLAKEVREKGAHLVGYSTADDYSFRSSAAEESGRNISPDTANGMSNFPPEGKEVRAEGGAERRFEGLVIDQIHQPERTDQRIQSWVGDLRREFHL